MGISQAILNICLAGVWIGIPIVVMAYVGVSSLMRAKSEGSENDSASPIQQLLPTVLIASTLTILIDRFFLTSIEFRRLVYAVPWGADAIRVLLFPLCLLVGRAIALAVTMIKPSEVDARFQRDLKGMSPLWASLGFCLAIGAFFWRDDTWSNSMDLDDRSKFPVDTAPLIDVRPEAATNQIAPIFSGENYERFADMITGYATAQDLPPGIVLALVSDESNFNPNFRGLDGGTGLLNVTGSMARQVGVDDYITPSGNLLAGTLVLKSLRDAFGANNPRLWVAAYHFGTKRIQDDPTVVDTDGEIKSFVDGVMRKVG